MYIYRERDREREKERERESRIMMYIRRNMAGEMGMAGVRVEGLSFKCIQVFMPICMCCGMSDFMYIYIYKHIYIDTGERGYSDVYREVGGWGRDPKKCTGSIWGMGSSTI